MKQGVLLNHRTRLLLDGSTSHYTPKRDGARKRKSVRGCIVGPDLSSLNLVIVKRGPEDLEGLTESKSDKPSTRGPKRANHIRRVWGLTKTEDVRKYVVRRKIEGKNGKPDFFKSPKIQRLITPVARYRKKQRLALKKQRHDKSLAEQAEYHKLLTQKRNLARASLLSKKREARSEKHSVKAVDDKKKSPQEAVSKSAAPKVVKETKASKETPKPAVQKPVKAKETPKAATSKDTKTAPKPAVKNDKPTPKPAQKVTPKAPAPKNAPATKKGPKKN
eukprot:TRINITY_DN159_c0_g1_i2.p1 TRINITY_DN159_c0_g1~~TRINITY_DN159_c0_g1_i2.p1  ORF type:complete len:276 (-),score=52.15 TRINITY_DN159_c0_g1_i2:102-929(-)